MTWFDKFLIGYWAANIVATVLLVGKRTTFTYTTGLGVFLAVTYMVFILLMVVTS